ncbi:MAG: peptidoglycan DD-metalloendopeptidase family protein [Negativicutes bacterium]|nr:peptidoglycan DD-metalloendopeptidase family protein [Negativicutes bacterium]
MERSRIVLPVWNESKLAWQKVSNTLAVRRSRIGKTMMAVLLTMVILIGAAIPRTAYQVMIGQEVIGTVQSPEIGQKLVSEVLAESGISSSYSLVADPAVSYYPVMQRESFSTNNELKAALSQKMTIKALASVIFVEDRAKIALASAADVNQVLDNVRLYYTSGSGEVETLQAQFSDTVTVHRETVDLAEVKTVNEATNLLVSGSIRSEVVTVNSGDTIWDIAMAQSVSVDELLANNPNAATLKPGDQLVINQAEPMVGVVTNETVREEISLPYTTETRYSDAMYVTESQVLTAGSYGLKVAEYAITRQNGIEVTRVSLGETIVSQPVTQVVLKGTQIPYGVGTGTFIWPLWGSVTAGYGWYEYGYHRGMDISTGNYATIVAADSGVVTDIGYDYFGLGNYITINHNNGYMTRYGHLSSFLVSYGQSVRQGDAIGIEGNTGYSFGTHLHFEILVNGVRVNPWPYLP